MSVRLRIERLHTFRSVAAYVQHVLAIGSSDKSPIYCSFAVGMGLQTDVRQWLPVLKIEVKT